MSTLGERIVQARQAAGFSGQREFARSLGITYGAVSAWEKSDIRQGRRIGKPPGRDNLAKIAEATGVSVEWLLSGKGPSHRPQARDDDETTLLLVWRRSDAEFRKHLIHLLRQSGRVAAKR